MIRIGTRASGVALRRARIVQMALEAAGVACELITYRTLGDKNIDVPLTSMGARGLFTTELEKALRKQKIDIAVHSMSDMPAGDSDGVRVAAVLARGDTRDALVINSRTQAGSLNELPSGSRVAVSSLQGRAQLLAARPDLEVAELRGDLPTRLKKIDEGRVHAAILAASSLRLLAAEQHVTTYFESPEWMSGAGQGVTGLQIRSDNAEVAALIRPLNHEPTMTATIAEWSFVTALEGGPHSPIGALVLRGAGNGKLHGLISTLDGNRVAQGCVELDETDPGLSGIRLANELRREGGSDILDELRSAEKLPTPQPE